MVLVVAKPKAQPKVKVVNNYGMQGSTYNPQPAASGTVVQTTAPAKKLQPAASGNTVQPAASAAAVQAAAQAMQVAAAAAAERQRAAVRVQGQVATNVSANTAALKLQVTQAVSPRIRVGRPEKTAKIDVPDYRTDFEKTRDKAYLEALREVDRERDGGQKKGFSKVWDKLTFGQDRRDVAARSHAEKRLEDLTTRRVGDYSKRVNRFLKEQAARRAKVEGTKFATQDAFDRAVAEYTAWESAQINALEGDRAQLTGFAKGLEKAGSRPLGSFVGKSLGVANKLVVKPAEKALGKVWQYTLGSGDQNVPSIVTAPSRFINFIGNLNTPGRTVYQEGGGSKKLAPGAHNAWTATQTQRNFNIKPWTDISPNSSLAHKLFDSQVQSLINSRRQINPNRPPDDPEKLRKGFVEAYNQQHRLQNSALVNVADPMIGAGLLGKLGAGAKLGSYTERLATPLKGSKFGRFISSATKKVATSNPVSWLRAEAKTPQQRLSDALDVAKITQGEVQKVLLPRVNAINRMLTGPGKKLDVSVISDIEKLTDDEAAVLQRMIDGKVSGRDRLKFVDIPGLQGGMKQARARLEALARRYNDFTEQLKTADDVISTRFGKGKKTYSPRTSWIQRKGKSLDDYNFKLMRKFKGEQTARDLHRGVVDRYFKSNLDESFAGRQIGRRAELKAERARLVQQYDDKINPVREGVEKAYAKTRTPYGRARTFLAKRGPTALWKKSVLKYRPAWYANNFLYNLQAATLAGGPRALAEHVRLLRPRNFKRALSDVPDDVRTKLASEIGKGRISKFGNNLENWSRLSAFRAAKAKGLSDEAAIKRVNRYLLDYTTKNWERPLKAVVPFWSFQKGLAKAAVQMPFDRPIAAVAYNKLDEHQKQQFAHDFDKVVPRLRELGYSDFDIDQMRQEQSKYFGGRLKVGGQYITTPFNAFSEKGLSNVGGNPYLAALGEVATSTDSFGRPISGRASSFSSRFISKFPQAQLAKEGIQKALTASGRLKPTARWIGEPGSEGYGLTKEAQGYDPSKPNYRADLDKGAKFTQDLAAFLGKPRGISFDATKFLERKTMQKLKAEYFAVDWKSMTFPEQEQKRNQLFKKYGVTSDKFYKGELAKYDSADTTRIKAMKEDARKKTQALFAEYGRQPKGTRNTWATQKLKELVDSGYFASNPFLKSFDWTNPATIAKAHKKISYDTATSTGSWTAYNAKYGMSEKVKNAQFWKKYHATPDAAGRRQLLRDNPQYAKNGVKDEKTIAAAKFWATYAKASPADRKRLLADNPQYNTRADWTPVMWAAWRAEEKQKMRRGLSGVSGFSANLASYVASNRKKAAPVLLKKNRAKTKKLVFSAS